MKKAIVIGGTTGIGNALSKQLIKNNYKVAITGIENDIISKLNKQNSNESIVQYLDCINDNVIEEILGLIKKLGGLDLLVFSAGIGNLNKNLGYKVENQANQLNILAFTKIIDWTYRYFEEQGHGHLVAVTSLSGLFGCSVAPAYHAAKAYQISYIEAMAQKARKSGKPIHITDVRPGYVETPMTEGKKVFWMASKEKAAKRIFFLIKRKKSYGYISKRWFFPAVILRALPSWARTKI